MQYYTRNEYHIDALILSTSGKVVSNQKQIAGSSYMFVCVLILNN